MGDPETLADSAEEPRLKRIKTEGMTESLYSVSYEERIRQLEQELKHSKEELNEAKKELKDVKLELTEAKMELKEAKTELKESRKTHDILVKTVCDSHGSSGNISTSFQELIDKLTTRPQEFSQNSDQIHNMLAKMEEVFVKQTMALERHVVATEIAGNAITQLVEERRANGDHLSGILKNVEESLDRQAAATESMGTRVSKYFDDRALLSKLTTGPHGHSLNYHIAVIEGQVFVNGKEMDMKQFETKMTQMPWKIVPEDFDIKCWSCQKVCSLRKLDVSESLRGVHCSSCKSYNICVKADTGYKWVKNSNCGHLLQIKEDVNKSTCVTCRSRVEAELEDANNRVSVPFRK